jgi:hypothetical protein
MWVNIQRGQYVIESFASEIGLYVAVSMLRKNEPLAVPARNVLLHEAKADGQ